jgi:hypothetical protein
MGHRVIDAIIEDGQLKYVGENLPAGRIKVHLIYDTIEESVAKQKAKEIVKRTTGIYPGIDAVRETKMLRRSWERKTVAL